MMNPYGFGYGMMGGSWVGGLLMLLFWFLVIAGIAMLIAWAVRGAGRQHHGMPPASPSSTPPVHDEAVATARRRFAAGEITKEQFDEIMQALGR